MRNEGQHKLPAAALLLAAAVAQTEPPPPLNLGAWSHAHNHSLCGPAAPQWPIVKSRSTLAQCKAACAKEPTCHYINFVASSYTPPAGVRACAMYTGCDSVQSMPQQRSWWATWQLGRAGSKLWKTDRCDAPPGPPPTPGPPPPPPSPRPPPTPAGGNWSSVDAGNDLSMPGDAAVWPPPDMDQDGLVSVLCSSSACSCKPESSSSLPQRHRLKTDDVQSPPPPLPPWVPPPSGFPTNPCPCGELCKPLRRSVLENRTKAQFFGFFATKIYNGSGDAWLHWDWQTISTVEVWSTWHLPGAGWGLLCRAHAEGVRVVVPLRGGAGSGYVTGSDNASARKQWITMQVVEMDHFGLDGGNFDVEGQYNTSRKSALTSLICETRQAMQQYLPDATLTFDLAIAPDNPTIRGGYDYAALAKCLDYIIPM